DSVEHTARRAGPSVADAGDHRVTGGPKLLDDLLVSGDAGVVLPPHPGARRAVIGYQDVSDLLEEPVRVELGVLDEADALARERVGPRDELDRLRRDLDGRIQDLDHCLTSLVTAWEERLPPHPGM